MPLLIARPFVTPAVTCWQLFDFDYASISKDVTTETSNFQCVTVSPDRTKMIVMDIAGTDQFFEYDISGGLAGATYTGNNNVTGHINSTGMFFREDGLKAYTVGFNDEHIREHTLTVPFDVSTLSFTAQSIDIGAQGSRPRGLFLKPDGTKVFVIESNSDTVYRYTLSTPWDITTLSYDGASFILDLNIGGSHDGQDIWFCPDGTSMFVLDSVGGTVDQYVLPTAWNPASASSTPTTSLTLSAGETTPVGIAFDANGEYLYVADNGTDTIYQYDVFQ